MFSNVEEAVGDRTKALRRAVLVWKVKILRVSDRAKNAYAMKTK